MIPAPVILLPSGGVDYTTDTEVQTISGTTSADTAQIKVNGSVSGVSYTSGEIAWAWTGTLTVGQNILQVTAIDKTTGLASNPAIIVVTLIDSQVSTTVSQPTGIKLKQYQDKVEILCSGSTEQQVIGYNFYVSTQSGGINRTYAKINTELVTEPSSQEENTRQLSTSVDTVGNIRTTTTIEEVNVTDYYSTFFDETAYNRLVSEGLIENVPFTEDNSFFFVATAIVYDSVLGVQTESSYSAELEGSPITITTGIRDLPSRTQTDIILTYSREILTGNAGADTKPGTALRDILDPISEEQARVYVIQDFMSRSLGVTSLLDFDDADGDGISDPVTSSTQKRALQVALNISDPNDVQTLIDEQFDKLGSNVNIVRRDAERATGQVTFYVETPPIRDMYVYEGCIVSTIGDLDSGIPAQSYRTTTSRILEFSNRDIYYNAALQRYELILDVESEDAGESGNTDSQTIRTIVSGADSDFSVENGNPISFGSDEESNHDMASRIQLAFFTDTGTEGGYAKTSIGVSGVRNVRIEKAGDPLMRRDWDPLRLTHVGGKVDVYVEGSRSKQITDQIAFSFESVQANGGTQQDERFTVINAVSFQFQTQNTRVTAHTPIFEVSKVHNATRLADYDLTNLQIIGDGKVIDLDETRPVNVSIGLATNDIITVDYKYRSSDVFILSNQPVLEIVSVTGQLSGPLTTDNYELVRLQDPLEDGNSTIAQDGIRIKFANNLPLTEFQEITDESHVMIIGTDEPLAYYGVDTTSIVIKNSTKTVTFIENVDYQVIAGTDTSATNIRLIESGSILNGQTVLISYTAIENFAVVYTTNYLLSTVQEQVDKMKHACADTIVKQAIENDVDFVITVVPKSGVTNYNLLTSKIRTAVSNFVTQLGIGVSLTQSDIDHVIKGIDDVDYVVLPFLRMTKADGSMIIRDDVGKTQFDIYNEGSSTAYISTVSVLSYKTVDKGGPENMFRGVFEDNLPLVLQDDPLEVSDGPGRAYIQSDGKIIVSTKDGDIPEKKEYSVAYYVYGETGSNDINVNSIEYLNVGSFSISYDTPRDLSRQAF